MFIRRGAILSQGNLSNQEHNISSSTFFNLKSALKKLRKVLAKAFFA